MATLQHRVPTSDGNSTWTPSSGTDRYAMVDDPPGSPNDSEDISRADSNASQIFDFTDFAITSTSVNEVYVTFRGRHDTGDATQLRARITVGGTIYNGTYQALTDSFVTYAPNDWTTNPDTAAAWLEADVEGSGSNPLTVWRVQNNLTAGGETVYCSQTFITVSYETAAAGNPWYYYAQH